MASMSGDFSLITFMSMLANPKTAFVGRPDDVDSPRMA
jgi:hypothetical protein